MNVVLRARTRGELDDVLRDLPRSESRLVADLRITTTVGVRPPDRVAFGAVRFSLTWMDQPE